MDNLLLCQLNRLAGISSSSVVKGHKSLADFF